MTSDKQSNIDNEEIRTGLEREIEVLEKRADSERHQLRSKLKQLGINTGRQSLEDITINPQQYMIRQDSYGYMQAKRARSTQNNLHSTLRRLEQVRKRHESIKEERRSEADNHENS